MNASNPEDAARQDALRLLVDRLIERLRALIRARSLRDPMSHLAPELTSPQVHAIFALGIDAQPLSMSVLAHRIDASLPATTGIVDRLERDGYVERLRDEHDRRVVLVRLTEKGCATFGQADEQMRLTLATFLGVLADGERTAFVDVICRALDVFIDRPIDQKP